MIKSRATAPRRADTQRIGDMIDFATGAKQIADNLGERFLAYLLAMVIQEMGQVQARHAVRPATAPHSRSESDVSS